MAPEPYGRLCNFGIKSPENAKPIVKNWSVLSDPDTRRDRRRYAASWKAGIQVRRIALAAFAAVLATAAHADTSQNCAAAWRNMPPVSKGDMTQKEWLAKCRKPTYTIAEYGAPGYAIAICKDGHFS